MRVAAVALVALCVSTLGAFPRPAVGEPVSYTAVLAAEAAGRQTPTAADGSETADTHGDPLAVLHTELLQGDPDWRASARLYHAGGGGATGNDSLGCRPIPMRTVAVDPRIIPRRTRLFIRETVGLRMADGTLHDGFWYASDTGGAIKGAKVDLYTGHGRASMNPIMRLNMRTLSISNAGRFDGCPPDWSVRPALATFQMASN